jgi:hypothetical protein
MKDTEGKIHHKDAKHTESDSGFSDRNRPSFWKKIKRDGSTLLGDVRSLLVRSAQKSNGEQRRRTANCER